MRKALALAASMALLGLVLTGCGAGGGAGGGGGTVYTDTSETIRAKVGQEFTIALESNPTTGYSWQLAGDLDEEIVEEIGSEYVQEPGSEEMVGAGGTEYWTFKASGAGETTISLEYVRPWEEEEPPVETADFDVEVD